MNTRLRNHKIGLSLSGGGFRGLMHLGVLAAMEELALQPQHIAATSFGGFMGALYAAGHRPKEILEYFKSFSVWPFLPPFPNIKGLASIKPLGKFLEKKLPKTFEELQLPLTINATNLSEGKSVFFDQGPLIEPLLAAATIPILFKPSYFQGQVLVDGGILNNMPLEPLLDHQCTFLIGCNSNHPGSKPIKHYKDVMERTFNLAINQNVEARKHLFHCLIEPVEMANFQVFDWKKGDELFDIGYRCAMNQLQTLLNS